VNLLIALFLTLSQALGVGDGSKPLLCVDRLTFDLRESVTKTGCLDSERSLGANAITKPKQSPTTLHPKVKLRFEVARRAALTEGVNLYIASGYRTVERQKFLFERAIKRYGSVSEATKWVLPPYLSNHPLGLAIDINYPDDPLGARWLEINGYRYGLCRVFDNEWWHFEASTPPGKSCPPRLKNAGKVLD
jgi:D-alanyl-D-alanine carboxypeptidase